MSTTVTYKGETLTTANNQTRTLETAGKYMEDDVTIVDVTASATLQSKTATYTPTESQQTATITADAGYNGLSDVDVTVEAVSSSYVGSGVTRRDSSDLTVSGATVTVPAGYYASSASESVTTMTLPTAASSSRTYTTRANINRSTSTQYLNISKGYTGISASYTISATPNGTAGTPTATKGTVSNHSVSVTPSVTNTTGYITGGTKSGTAVTVSASELVSGSQTITENDTYDVTNLASVEVNVSGGGGDTGTYIECYSTDLKNAEFWDSGGPGWAKVAMEPGSTVSVYTFGDWILDSVSIIETGESVAFTTINKNYYTFTMPDANVTYSLYYDD